ncbi:MAG: alpha/beta hydrolase [Bacteroidota bacterium]
MRRLIVLPFLLTIFLYGCTSIDIKEEDVFDVKRTIDPSYFQNNAWQLEEINFSSGKNLSLEGWFISHPASQGTVLYYGGNGFLMETAYETIQSITARQMNLFVFNYRGYGKNPGTPTIAGIKADGMAAYKYLVQSRGIPPSEIIIHGHSLGTLIAGYVADQKTIAALVMESPISEAQFYQDKMLPKILRPFIRINLDSSLLVDSNTDRLSRLSVPLLIIVGKDDPITPPAMARKLYNIAPAKNKTLKILEKGGHNDLPERKDYQAFLGDFYKNSLKQNLTNKDTQSSSR